MKKKPIVGIIDTGTSNIRSVFYALKESGAEIKQISNKAFRHFGIFIILI